MAWYAAHVVLYFRRKRNPQPRRFLVYENVFLVKAESKKAAFAKAEEYGRQDEGDHDGSLRLDDKPAELVFAGVRKLVECLDPDRRPTDGTEVSYTEMELRSEEAIRKLVAGKPVPATIVDFVGEEPAAANAEDVQRLNRRCS